MRVRKRRAESRMFFIFGIDQGKKEIGCFGPYICKACGSYGRYEVFMTYMCFSLFFIPVFKWGKRYYAQSTCCRSLWELNPETGRRLACGEQAKIAPEDLWETGGSFQGGSGGTGGRKTELLVCPSCGYETAEEFSYCPKCGARLEEKWK